MPKRKNSPPITKEQFLAGVMAQEPPDREKIIKEILEELHAYEMKYRMRSEIFFKLIVGTPLEDQPDFLDWAMCYREYLQIFQSQFTPERVAADVIG
jgi:hypothetical protein